MPVTKWLQTLWLWWAFSIVLILGLGTLAFVSHAEYTLKADEAVLIPRVHRLSDDFARIASQEADLLRLLEEPFRQDRLTLSVLRAARSQASGLSRFYAVTPDGRPVCPGDDGPKAPDWLLTAIRKHPPADTGTLTLMPLRPGAWERATLEGVAPPAILRVMQNARHEWLISEVNEDVLLGTWLRDQLQSLGLPPQYSLLLTATEPAGSDPKATPGGQPHTLAELGLWAALQGNSRTELSVNTFIALPTDGNLNLRISFDPGGPIRHLALLYGLGLLACLPLLGGFGFALRLASRNMGLQMQVSEDRANFTAMVSHELKTPIAAISMYAEILEHQLITDPDKIADYHRIIGTETHRLRRMVDNLLDLARIQRRQRRYERAPVAVATLIDLALAHARQAHGETTLAVTVSLETGLPLLWVDQEAVVQAVTNLIHNAFKYGGTPPEVSVHARAVGVAVAIDVMDRGPGIPDDTRHTIFNPYVRLENEAIRQTQGSGLGLALVKAYVEDQGGRVGVAGRPGGGSIFSLILPARTEETPDAPAAD